MYGMGSRGSSCNAAQKCKCSGEGWMSIGKSSLSVAGTSRGKGTCRLGGNMNSVVDASGCLADWMDASSSAKDGSTGVSLFDMGANLVSSFNIGPSWTWKC